MTEVLDKPALDFGEKPRSLDDPWAIAEHALNWVRTYIPYIPNNYYRPELAAQRGGGNCYAQALGGVALLESYGISAGIVLDSNHAHFLMKLAGAVLFIEPGSYGGVKGMKQMTVWRGIPEPGKLYQSVLPDLMDRDTFSTHFYQDVDGWHSKLTTSIRTNDTHDQQQLPHIIVDSQQGKDMLCAIGDLKRYKAIDKASHGMTDHYATAYDQLISFVPDFIDELEPPQTLSV